MFYFFKDEKNSKERHRFSVGNALQFHRRHSALSSTCQTPSTIILHPSIFRKNFRPTALQVRDYTRTSSKNNF